MTPKLDRAAVHLLDDTRLLAALREGVQFNVETFYNCALLFAEATSRGLDTSFVPRANVFAYQMLADDKVAPEVAFAFANSKRRLVKLALLRRSEQVQIATGKPVTVVRVRQGQMKAELVPGNLLRNFELDLVIGDSRLRSEHEQRAMLEQRAARSAMRAKRRVAIDLAEDVHSRLLHLADRKKLPLGVYIVELLDWALQGQELGDTLGADKSEGGAA